MKQRRRPSSEPSVAPPSCGQIPSGTTLQPYGNAAVAERLPAAVPAVGALDYYTRRHDDFLSRHGDAGARPPDYYLGYGDKYVRRFSQEVFPLLSPDGQAWLERVRVGLQEAIEEERGRDPVGFDALEQDGTAFRSFAFDTHPEAYWEAGLEGLPVADLLTIGLTPDTADLLSLDGLVQVGDILGRLVRARGAGALVDLAGAVGSGLGSLGRGLHGLLDGAVRGVVGMVDSLTGEGVVAGLFDVLRRGAQRGVEWLEHDLGTPREASQSE